MCFFNCAPQTIKVPRRWHPAPASEQPFWWLVETMRFDTACAAACETLDHFFFFLSQSSLAFRFYDTGEPCTSVFSKCRNVRRRIIRIHCWHTSTTNSDRFSAPMCYNSRANALFHDHASACDAKLGTPQDDSPLRMCFPAFPCSMGRRKPNGQTISSPAATSPATGAEWPVTRLTP